MKKIISKASVFLLMLIIGLIPVKMADAAYSGEETGSITINNVTSGNTFHGYKIIDIKYDSIHDKVDYAWSSGIDDIFKDKKISIEEFVSKSEKDRQKLLSGIPKALNGVPDLEAGTADSTGTVKWSGVALGGYLIIPINTADVYQIMFAIVQPVQDSDSNDYHTKSAEIEAKKTPVTITKTADSQSMGISKTVNYTIISDVPVYAEGASDKYYGISDKADKELVIDKNSIKIYGYSSRENAKNDREGTEYGTLTPNSDYAGLYKECTKLESQTEEQDFAIEFDYDKIPKGIKAIKIVYTGKIKSDAVIGANGLNNSADMEYSSFPFSKEGENRNHDVKNTELNITVDIQTETIEDSKRFNLPQTGDYGTLIFTIAGTVLMLGSVVMFFVMRRRGKI